MIIHDGRFFGILCAEAVHVFLFHEKGSSLKLPSDKRADEDDAHGCKAQFGYIFLSTLSKHVHFHSAGGVSSTIK